MSQPTRACPTCKTPLPGTASFCYVCGTATPAGINRETGEHLATGKSGIGPADLIRKLQRALGPGYELKDRIGAGGFAEVFRARDLRLKRDLAVKVLRPDLGLSPELLQRFRREAETIAALRNPHIVPVYDVGEAEGLAFIIMPLIAGESLRQILDRDGAMPAPEVRRILREAASGLAAAHDAGVVHRDIKPENIMLEGRDKRVLLMDFGIAKAMSGGEGDPSEALTTTGIIIGTPQYMSPEQACGDKTIDHRTDQYSLAVVAYRMLSGVLPFEGDSTRAVLYQQLVAEPTPITTKVANVPPALAVAIQRAMAKEPKERFTDMIEFAAMLDAAESSMTAPTAAIARPDTPVSKRKFGIGLWAGAAVVAVALIWFGTRGKSEPPPSIPVAAPTPPPAPENVAATPPPAPPPVVAPGKTGAVAPPAGATSKRGQTAGGATTTTAAAPQTPPAGSGRNTTASPAPAGCAHASESGDWNAAATSCTKEADAGNAVAQRILGTMYDNGRGVAADPAQAVNWYRKAATTDVEAKFLLSHMIEIGRGTQRNDGEATALLREAAAGGLLRAQQILATRLETGTGVKKDEAESALWYRRAAEKGDAASQTKLAEFLAKGKGVNKNETEALDWYRKAATSGSGEAAWQLSQMYFKGKGTAKDEAAGMEWLKKAADKNQPDAVKELKKREG